MSKQQLIEQICTLNETVQPEYLVTFDHSVLENYLKRLAMARAGRGRTSIWVRTGQNPASSTR